MPEALSCPEAESAWRQDLATRAEWPGLFVRRFIALLHTDLTSGNSCDIFSASGEYMNARNNGKE
jgi:hypothetical protein